jgi:inhibitor of cysteine peptidase
MADVIAGLSSLFQLAWRPYPELLFISWLDAGRVAGVCIDNSAIRHQAHLQPILNRRNFVSHRSSLVPIFLLAIAACINMAAQQGTRPAPSAAPSGVVLTERDNGTEVELAPNTALTVKLTSNPSAGYAWTVVGDPSPLKLQKASFRKGTTKSGAVGAPGTAVFQLNASSAGMATLSIIYRRSWEYNVPPMKTFSVRVNVR